MIDRDGRERLAQRTAVAVALALGAAAVWSRVAGLDQSLWHDEAHSALRYFTTGPAAILGGYYVPNDHVLFSLLTWATASIAGTSEPVLRLWAVVPGLAAVAWLTVWTWRRYGAVAGLTVELLTVASPLLLDVSRQARGYGLAVLLMAVAVTGALDLVAARGSVRRSELVVATSVVLAVWTLPVLALPGGLLIATLVVARRWPAPWVSVPLGIALTGLPYWHRLDEVRQQSGQDIGLRPSWPAVAIGWFTDLVQPTFLPGGIVGARVAGALDGGVGSLVLGLVALIAVAAGLVRLRRESPSAVAVVCVPVLGTYVGLLVARVDVADRFLVPLLPWVALALAIGASALGRRAVRAGDHAVAAGALLAAVLVLLALPRWWEVSTALIAAPAEDLRGVAAAADAAAAPGAVVLTTSRSPTGFDFYLVAPLESVEPGDLRARVCTDARPIVLIDQPFVATGPIPVDCLRERGATRERFLSRPLRGRFIDVWTVPAAGRPAG